MINYKRNDELSRSSIKFQKQMRSALLVQARHKTDMHREQLGRRTMNFYKNSQKKKEIEDKWPVKRGLKRQTESLIITS